MTSRGMTDMLSATMALAERCGAAGLDIGFTGHEDEDTGTDWNPCWYATVMFQGTRIMIGDRHTPEEACLALSIRLLRGATCKCTKPVTLDEEPGCRWILRGDRWVPGCTDPAIHVSAGRGDYAAIQAALERRQRRGAKRSR